MATFEAKTAASFAAPPRPFTAPSIRRDVPLDLIVRAGIVQAFAYSKQLSIEHACDAIGRWFPRYGGETTKVVSRYLARGATAPATTFESGWAAELVQTLHADVIEMVMGRSAFAQLCALGLSLNFGRAGQIAV